MLREILWAISVAVVTSIAYAVSRDIIQTMTTGGAYVLGSVYLEGKYGFLD